MLQYIYYAIIFEYETQRNKYSNYYFDSEHYTKIRKLENTEKRKDTTQTRRQYSYGHFVQSARAESRQHIQPRDYADR